MKMQTNGSPIYQTRFKTKTWEEFQSAVLDVTKSFPDDFKFGDIDENQKIIDIKYTKPPFDEGLEVFITYQQNDNWILVDFFREENNLPAIKKQEAIDLSEKFGKDIYFSFSDTLHLTAKAGPQKEKRENQETLGGGAMSFIVLIIAIVVIFFGIKSCSSI